MRAIVYNDIEKSNFYVVVGKIKLYFSSEFNKKRFEENYDNYIREENFKIENRYHTKIVAFYYFIISFYKKIEKRGFRIENVETGARVNENLVFHIEL